MIEIEGPLPLLVLPETVLFPGIFMLLHFSQGEKSGIPEAGGYLVCAPALQARVGCLAEVHSLERLSEGRLHARVGGLYRVRFARAEREAREIELLPDRDEDERIATLYAVLGRLQGLPEPLQRLHGHAPPGLWLDMLAHHLPLVPAARLRLLEEPDVLQRGSLLVHWLTEAQPAPPRPPQPVYPN